MGTYRTGANGAFSGKVGSVVGSNWRNVDYLRGLPKRTSKKATSPQVAQRAKFALSSVYLRPIKDVLNLGFGDKNLVNSSGYNAAAKYFLTTVVLGEFPDFSIDFPAMKLSKGSLSIFHTLTASSVNSDILLSWKSILNHFNSFADDSLMVILYSETKHMYMIYESALRNDLTQLIELGTDFSGDAFHVWAFSVKRDASEVGNSQYLGNIILL